MKLVIESTSAAGSIRGTSEDYNSSRHTTRDKKIIIVMRSEKRAATRARPKIDGLLSTFSLTPSYAYSPPKRDRTGFNHDRLKIMMLSRVAAIGD